jgi:biotin operon repressor
MTKTRHVLDKAKLSTMAEMLHLAAPNVVTYRLLEAQFNYTQRTLQTAVTLLRRQGVPVLNVQGLGYVIRKKAGPSENGPAEFREETSKGDQNTSAGLDALAHNI